MQAITGTFEITLSNTFLPMQLIYGGKTAQCIPKFKFPVLFSLSAKRKRVCRKSAKSTKAQKLDFKSVENFPGKQNSKKMWLLRKNVDKN